MEEGSYHTAQLKRIINKYITPHAAVFSSAKAKEIFVKFGITPAEFLRPFGEYGEYAGSAEYNPFPDINNSNNVVVTDLRLEFYDFESILNLESGSQQILESKLPDFSLESLNENIENYSSNFEMQKYVEGVVQEKVVSWYKSWEELFLDNCKFSSHELIDQPLLFFFIISSEDEKPDDEISKLCNLKSTITRYKESIYDTDYPHIYLVLHDKSHSVSIDVASMQLDRLRKKLAKGTNQCEMLSMQFTPDDEQHEKDIWANYRRHSKLIGLNMLDTYDRRDLLTINDREAMRLFMKDLIADKLIPFVASKIRQAEQLIRNTKKGLANYMKNIFNKKERSENDGLKKDFLMNQQEISMKSLIDISFLFQDYRTFNSFYKYPTNELKSIKAIKHYSSCYELQFFTNMLTSDSFNDSKEFQQQLFHAANSYLKIKDLRWMIRNLIITAELCKSIEKYEDAIRCYLKIAFTVGSSEKLQFYIDERSNYKSACNIGVIQALFYEQAAFCYLKLENYRKFCFYIIKAASVYEYFKYKEHSFYCFRMIEPYYTKFKWNEIRNYLYSSLSESSLYFGNIQLSVTIFRNLLQLCCDIEESRNIRNSQNECLNQFFSVVGKWNQYRKNEENALIEVNESGSPITYIGYISLPKFLDDQLEVFLNHEISIPYISENPNSLTSWRMLIRQTLTFIESEEEARSKTTPGLSDLYQSSRDEKFENSLFDSMNKYEKKMEALKKVRKVYAKEPIVFKIYVKNPLMTDVEISKIFLKCKFIKSEAKPLTEDDYLNQTVGLSNKNDPDFYINFQSITLLPATVKEITLEITPLKEGEIFILGIEWILFNAVSCNYYFPSNLKNKDVTNENVSQKLKGKENMFHYQVCGTSANLELTFDKKLSRIFYYNEFIESDLKLTNDSDHTIKDVYLKVSHPIFFGFSCIKITDEIPPHTQINRKLWFKAVGYLGTQNVKFLTRYRVIKNNGDFHVRMSRAICEINITNSFDFTVSINNSCMDLEEKFSSEFVKNLFKIIDKKSSKKLKINKLFILKGSNKWILSIKDFKLINSEGSVSKRFKVKPTEMRKSKSVMLIEDERNSLISLDSTDDDIDFTKPPYSDFIDQEYKFFKNTMKCIKEYQNPELQTTSIAISWKIKKEGSYDIRGFHCIFGIVLNKQIVNNLAQLDNKDCISDPLVCFVDYEKIVKFNFKENDFCIVPFNITISNVMSTRSVTFCIEAEQNKRVRNKNDYFWTGVTKKNVKSLSPNQSMNIQFNACFTEPGVYDLNKIKVTVFKDPSTNEIIQSYENKVKCRNLISIEKQVDKSKLIVKIESE